MEAAGTEGMVREPSAEVAAKAKRRSAARDSKGCGAEQRGGTERQDRDAIACRSLLKIVSHGITFEVGCDHPQLPGWWPFLVVAFVDFAWVYKAFTSVYRPFTGPHTPAASLHPVSLQSGPIYAAGTRSGDMNVAMRPQAG
jgi:hypothetical protein